jgi:hypothetical protein
LKLLASIIESAWCHGLDEEVYDVQDILFLGPEYGIEGRFLFFNLLFKMLPSIPDMLVDKVAIDSMSRGIFVTA